LPKKCQKKGERTCQMPINKHSVFQEDFLLIFHQSYTLHFQETNHKGYRTWLSNTKNSCSLNIATQCTVGGLAIFCLTKHQTNKTKNSSSLPFFCLKKHILIGNFLLNTMVLKPVENHTKNHRWTNNSRNINDEKWPYPFYLITAVCILPKIIVKTEEQGMQNVTKSFLNEHSHLIRNLCLRIRILQQKGFCLIVSSNSFINRIPILHTYLIPKIMRHICTCSFAYKNNLTL